MSRTPLPLTGKRFGRLVAKAIEGTIETPGGTKRIIWRCLCDCGKEKVVRSSDLVSGAIKSCGCLLSEVSRARHLRHGHTSATGKRSREYDAWGHAKQRCTNPKNNAWDDYGGRGITMCDRWLDSFEAFLSDMGPCPEGFEIDRENVNGNYEPDNCRWVPYVVQMNNMRTNRVIEVSGKKVTVAQAARSAGVPAWRVYARLNNGWTVDEALGLTTRTTKRR